MATIYSNKGIPILCDDDDFDWLNRYSWSIERGYATTGIRLDNGKHTRRSMHRIIMNPPADMLVDHINHLRCDNRRSNLRIVTAKENMNNKLAPRRLLYDKPTGKYWLCRGYELIGIYDTKAELHEAYGEVAFGGMPTHTNTSIPSD